MLALKAEMRDLWDAFVCIVDGISSQHVVVKEDIQGIFSLFMRDDKPVYHPLICDARTLDSERGKYVY